MLYYEDVRLTQMATLVQVNRPVKGYSIEFLSEHLLKYLLQQAQKY